MYVKSKTWSGESLPWGENQMPFGSIGVRSAPYRKRFRSNFGLGAANCSVLPFYGQGLVSPECWCQAVGKTICDWMNGEGTYAAAVMMNAPDVAFPQTPAPPSVTGPSTVEQETVPGAFTPDMAIAGQQAASQNSLAAFFSGIAANAQQAGNPPAGTTINWGLWIGIGAAGLLGFALLKGGR